VTAAVSGGPITAATISTSLAITSRLPVPVPALPSLLAGANPASKPTRVTTAAVDRVFTDLQLTWQSRRSSPLSHDRVVDLLATGRTRAHSSSQPHPDILSDLITGPYSALDRWFADLAEFHFPRRQKLIEELADDDPSESVNRTGPDPMSDSDWWETVVNEQSGAAIAVIPTRGLNEVWDGHNG
jgi:hypothetical protein